MKNKVTRDLSQQERSTEDKIKQFRNFITEKNDASEARNEATFELMKDSQKKMDHKLSQIEVTEVVLDYVNHEIAKVQKSMALQQKEND